MDVEVQSLGKYLSENEEWMLKFAAEEKELPELEHLDAFEKRLKEEKRSQWLEKLFHGRFLKDAKKMSTERTDNG